MAPRTIIIKAIPPARPVAIARSLAVKAVVLVGISPSAVWQLPLSQGFWPDTKSPPGGGGGPGGVSPDVWET